jgi:hypothetical protein
MCTSARSRRACPLGRAWIALVLSGLIPVSALAADLVKAKDGSGVYGYKDTPLLPWCGFLVHDPDRPAPKRVDPGPVPPPAPVPADALVLFDGTDLSRWEATDWKVIDGTVVAGAARTCGAATNSGIASSTSNGCRRPASRGPGTTRATTGSC